MAALLPGESRGAALARMCMAAVAVMLACAAHGQANSASPGPGAASASVTVATAADRQKAAHADAERMLSLAKSLKESVDKSRKDELNIQVIRDAEEIEKLARSLRSRVP